MIVYRDPKHKNVSHNFRNRGDITLVEAPEVVKSMIQCLKECKRQIFNPALPLYNNSNYTIPALPPAQLETPNFYIPLIIAFLSALFLNEFIYKRFLKKKTETVSVSTEVETDRKEGSNTSKFTESDSSQKVNDEQKNSDIIVKKNDNFSKKQFEIFTKEVLGLGSQGTIVYNGKFQGRSVAIKRFLRNYFILAKSEIDIFVKVENKNIVKYYFYQEDE